MIRRYLFLGLAGKSQSAHLASCQTLSASIHGELIVSSLPMGSPTILATPPVRAVVVVAMS